MINYLFLSYVLFPFAFALGVYLEQKHKLNSEGKTTPLWMWVVFILGDLFKNKKLLSLFLISPITLPFEICHIIYDLCKNNERPC